MSKTLKHAKVKKLQLRKMCYSHLKLCPDFLVMEECALIRKIRLTSKCIMSSTRKLIDTKDILRIIS